METGTEPIVVTVEGMMDQRDEGMVIPRCCDDSGTKPENLDLKQLRKSGEMMTRE